MTDHDDPDEKRTEGVRIIGAQEAAQAAGRPDVVRRRRRSEKKFGDRPDQPHAADDLPKIRISTTETTSDPGGTFGAVPVVRPDLDEYRPDEGDEGAIVVTGQDRPRVGHARLLGPDDGPGTRGPDPEEPEPAGQGFGTDPDTGSAAAPTGDDTEAWDTSGLFESDLQGTSQAQDISQAQGTSQAQDEPEPHGGIGDGWAIDEPMVDDPDDGFGESEDEGSFSLPHWTEPPTGQVPKVVTGVEPDEDPSFVESPRWHSEGERVAMTDFTDLADDGPRLGALGGRFDEFDDDDDGDFFAPGDDLDEGVEDDFFAPDDGDEFVESVPGSGGRPKRPGDRRDVTQPPSGGDRDLVSAVLVGLGLVGIGLFCFWRGGLTTTILVTVILVLAALEALTALNGRGFATPTVLALPAVAGLMFGTYAAGVEAYPVVLGLIVITSMLWYLWVTPGHRAAQKLGGTLLVVMWVGFLGSFATLMLGIGREMQNLDSSLKSNPGIGVLIAAVIVTVSHDVGAYFTGRYLGRTPLSTASPNKTYEGLAGGILAGIVVPLIVVGFGSIHPIGDSIAKTIVFSALCAAVAPLGDLCQSAIKRDLKIKDMGAVLPGHGGVLDRFDAMLFVLPTAYFVTLLMGVWTLSAR